MNSARFRQRESGVYASDTFCGSREFHASSAMRTFWIAVSRVNIMPYIIPYEPARDLHADAVPLQAQAILERHPVGVVRPARGRALRTERGGKCGDVRREAPDHRRRAHAAAGRDRA